MQDSKRIFDRTRPHPWHGLSTGEDPPGLVNAYIEMTPFDLVKYEIDPKSGYLRVDRPHLTSSLPPMLYGFVPRTLCDAQVASMSEQARGGDGDALDICVISERPINRAEILLTARVVGGLHTLDHAQADDKIIAVLHQDEIYRPVETIDDLPPGMIRRLVHYFANYKAVPGQASPVREVHPYGLEHARAVVEAAMMDYRERFGEPEAPKVQA